VNDVHSYDSATFFPEPSKKRTDTNSVLLLVSASSIITHMQSSPLSRGMIGKEQIAKMKKGAYLVNNARGPIVDRDAVVEASKSGQLGGYGGAVWYPQPPGKVQTPLLRTISFR
jgi:formate dehydrogenase